MDCRLLFIYVLAWGVDWNKITTYYYTHQQNDILKMRRNQSMLSITSAHLQNDILNSVWLSSDIPYDACLQMWSYVTNNNNKCCEFEENIIIIVLLFVFENTDIFS